MFSQTIGSIIVLLNSNPVNASFHFRSAMDGIQVASAFDEGDYTVIDMDISSGKFMHWCKGWDPVPKAQFLSDPGK